MEVKLIDTTRLVEIRWHGRGGQGAVTSAELLAQAAINEGKNAQAFPLFGMERRGAPVQAFDRIDPNKPVRMRGEVLEPDVVVVLDPTLMNIINVTAGLKQKGFLIINTSKGIGSFEAEFGTKYQMATVDASRIARDLLGVNIVNTTMLGALLRSVAVVDIESLVKPLEKRFERLAERNINAMRRAYEETVVKE